MPAIVPKISVKLIEDWHLSWKLWSVRLNAIGSLLLGYLLASPDAISGAWNALPADMKALLPHQIALALPLVLMVAATAARLVKQKDVRNGAA